MFLVNRTLRSFRTSALHPFRTRALRPPPIAHPLAYYASKRVIHSEFSKAGLGTGNTIHPKVSHVTPCSGEDVCEEDKADLRHQAKGSGDIHKRVAILQAVQQQAIVGAIPRLEGGVKEFKLELGEGAGGSKVKLNEYMGWLGSNFWMMITVLVGFGGMVSYDHFCYNPKLELELDQCVERGVFKGNAKYRAQIAEVSEMVKAEMRELRESTRRK